MRDLEEHLPAAEEFLKLADIVSGWQEDRESPTRVAADVAVPLALADRWEPAATACRRAVAHSTEGLDEALDHLAQAGALIAVVPAEDESFAP